MEYGMTNLICVCKTGKETKHHPFSCLFHLIDKIPTFKSCAKIWNKLLGEKLYKCLYGNKFWGKMLSGRCRVDIVWLYGPVIRSSGLMDSEYQV